MGRIVIDVARCFLLAAGSLMLLVASAAAGWYHVENYVGSVGSRPVHLSLQSYARFGSGITTEGSYFYDAKASPIPLYGRTVGRTLTLCEIPDDKTLYRIIAVGSKTPIDAGGCPVSLEMTDGGARGTWSQGGTTYPVVLTKVAALDDTEAGKVDGDVAIPFWTQTSVHRFSGIYTKTRSGICLRRLQIINKTSKRVEQELNFDGDDCRAGRLMTPIYSNIEKRIENGVEIISIGFDDGGAGHTQDYAFDRVTRRYSPSK